MKYRKAEKADLDQVVRVASTAFEGLSIFKSYQGFGSGSQAISCLC